MIDPALIEDSPPAWQLASPHLAKLMSQDGIACPALTASIERAITERQRLFQVLREEPGFLNSDEATFVVFGSLARNELTSGSDVDWTLLVDAPVDPQHRHVVLRIKRLVEEAGFREPTAGGVFGSLAFSHGIVHQIGGHDDTNRNTSQRILLLLESFPFAATSIGKRAYDNVIGGILQRYLADDLTYSAGSPDSPKVPRFLLNDIIRYWRIMAVDYASKRWDRGDKGWAIRNLKLRMSRKLIFAAGLLMCLRASLKPDFQVVDSLFGTESYVLPMLNSLRRCVAMTPMEIAAQSLMDFGSAATRRDFLIAYNDFLATINDVERRNHLEKLAIESSHTDNVYLAAKEQTLGFDRALDRLFFEDHPPLTKLVRKYGVF